MKLHFQSDKYGLVQPDIRPVKESGELYVLRQPFSFKCNGHTIVIPEGFRLDGASVPHALWSVFFAADGVHRAAALVHDWLYECKGKTPDGLIYNRKMADDLFKQALIMYGVKSWQVTAAYRVVRM